jgi:hypothetical protein
MIRFRRAAVVVFTSMTNEEASSWMAILNQRRSGTSGARRWSCFYCNFMALYGLLMSLYAANGG